MSKHPKSKLLMIATEYPPAAGYGLARYASELSKALVAQGHEVHVATCNFDDQHHSSIDDGVHVHNLRQLTPVTHFDWVGNTILNNLWLTELGLDLNKEHGPFDAIVTHDWLGSQAGKALKVALDIPWILFTHDTEPGKRNGELTAHQQYIAEMERWSIDIADHIVTNSQFMARELKQLYGVREAKLSIIPCGVDPTRFMGQTNISDFRRLFARDEESLVAFAGRLSPTKGVQELLEFFLGKLKQGMKAKLVIAGDGTLRGELENRVVEAGALPHVMFTGHLGDKVLGALYHAADLVTVPSHYEPFGMVALEAASCGANVLVNSVGGLSELAKAIPTIRSLPLDQWKREFESVISSPGSPDRAGVEEFTWEHVAKAVGGVVDSQTCS